MATAAAPCKLTSAQAVLTALRCRYESPAWAMFENVANATGSRANRWADALAMSVWPSRGLLLLGFEIKVSRNDVLRELRDPKKADEVGSYCDFWWMAVGSEAIAKADEMPPAWGLLAPVTNKGTTTMRVVKEAVKLKPKPLDRSFVAALLRRVHEVYDPVGLRLRVRDEVFSEIYSSVSESMSKQHETQLDTLREELRKSQEATNEARRQLRETLSVGYDSTTLARAVELLSRLSGWTGAEPALTRALSDIERNTESMATTRQGLRDALTLVQILTGKQPIEEKTA